MAKEWDKEEEKYLIENYRKIKAKDIAKALNKTVSSIYGKAYAIGLSHTEESSKELNILKLADSYTIDEICEQLGVCRDFVRTIFRKYNIYKSKHKEYINHDFF